MTKPNAALFINDGKILCPAPHFGGEELLARMPKARHVRMIWDQGRSRKHDGLFFASIREAYHNWPEAHHFQPESAEHLRQWLLCHARHRETTHITVPDGVEPGWLAETIKGVTAMMTSMSDASTRRYAFVAPSRSHILVHVAKSMRHVKVGEPEFVALSNEVSDLLKVNTGLGLEDYKRQYQERMGL